MKILLDANISWKLIDKLSPIFGVCVHVDYIGLDVPVEDIDIWNYAQNNGFIIITKDNDFLDFLDIYGFPPKVVLLRTGNNSSKELEELLINAKQMIEDLENSNLGLLEIINKK
jgi:predicted nuclease of predicted toxin-antitoxin system